MAHYGTINDNGKRHENMVKFIKRLRVYVPVIFGKSPPMNSAVVHHSGYYSVPDEAAKYAHILTVLEDIWQRRPCFRFESMADVETWLSGGISDDELLNRLYVTLKTDFKS